MAQPSPPPAPLNARPRATAGGAAAEDALYERLLEARAARPAPSPTDADGGDDGDTAAIVGGVQQLARGLHLRRTERDLPSDDDLLATAAAVLDFATVVAGDPAPAAPPASAAGGGDDAAGGAPPQPAPPAQLRLNYDAYCTVKEQLSGRVQRYLTASTFLKLPRDAEDRINGRLLLRYVVGRAQLAHFMRRLAAFDSVGDGALREHDLENYVFETIPAIPDLAGLQVNFFPFYVFTAVRKFFFFLDPQRTGRIRLPDLVASRVAAEWLQLSPPLVGGGGDGGAAAALLAAACPPPPSAANWFTAANALRVYSSYLELDADQNGMLRRSELAAFRGGTLTDAFLDRVFQEVHTYGGEVDYKAFLDFLLAAEYRASPASLRYTFRLLDLQHTGRLTLFELRYFLRDVAARMAAAGGADPVDVGSVCDEIFDMVAPAQPGVITLEDLRRCRVGHTVTHILTDVAGFFDYDNRSSV